MCGSSPAPKAFPEGGAGGRREGPHTPGVPLVSCWPGASSRSVGRGLHLALGAAGLEGCRIYGWQRLPVPKAHPGWWGGGERAPTPLGGSPGASRLPGASSRAWDGGSHLRWALPARSGLRELRVDSPPSAQGTPRCGGGEVGVVVFRKESLAQRKHTDIYLASLASLAHLGTTHTDGTALGPVRVYARG